MNTNTRTMFIPGGVVLLISLGISRTQPLATDGVSRHVTRLWYTDSAWPEACLRLVGGFASPAGPERSGGAKCCIATGPDGERLGQGYSAYGTIWFPKDVRGRSPCRDYDEPILEQGLMVPYANVDSVTAGMRTSLGMDHSFLMSNMTRQHCAFNSGSWMALENLVRHWAQGSARILGL